MVILSHYDQSINFFKDLFCAFIHWRAIAGACKTALTFDLCMTGSADGCHWMSSVEEQSRNKSGLDKVNR